MCSFFRVTSRGSAIENAVSGCGIGCKLLMKKAPMPLVLVASVQVEIVAHFGELIDPCGA